MREFRVSAVVGVGVVAAALAATQARAEADEAPHTVSELVLVGAKDVGAAGAKAATPIKEIPQTVTVIGRQRIEEQNLFTLEDLMTQTPGVTVTGISPESPSFLSRGFAIDAYLLDGVAGIGYPGSTPDLAIYDRVEVLRGAASLYSGTASPAGSINLVRKRPTAEFQASGAALAGSWSNYRIEGDVSGPLAWSGRLRGRLVGAYQDQDMFYDVAHKRRTILYGALAYDLTPRTTLTLGAHYQDFQPANQTGLPGYTTGGLLKVRRSTFLGADWNRFQTKDTVAFVELAHDLGGDWRVRATAQTGQQERMDKYAYVGNGAVTPTNGWTNQIAYYGDNFTRRTSFDLNLGGPVELFGATHDLLVGADHQTYDNKYVEWRHSSFARINVFDPVTNVPEPNYQPNGGGQTATEQTGLYANARLRPFASTTLVLGGRLSWYESASRSGGTRATPTNPPQPWTFSAWSTFKVEREFTPYVGIVHDLTPNWSLYASYADSFTPQSARTVDGAFLDPIVGRQYEAGVKGEVLDGRLLLSAAAYRINQVNRAQPDPEHEGFSIATGEVVSKGVELEATGRIGDNWSLSAGYAYNKNEYEKDVTNGGKPFTLISPEHSAKLYTNYRFTEGALKGFDLGLGVNAYGEMVGGTRPIAVRQPAYAVANLNLGYRLNERMLLRLSVNNLFDTTYYARISGVGRGNYYGEPRNVVLSLRATY